MNPHAVAIHRKLASIYEQLVELGEAPQSEMFHLELEEQHNEDKDNYR